MTIQEIQAANPTTAEEALELVNYLTGEMDLIDAAWDVYGKEDKDWFRAASAKFGYLMEEFDL